MLPRMLLVALRCIRHPVKELQPVIHTSILPPTRASKGGRGLSFSLFSCRRDCLRPPTKNKTKCTVRRTSSVSPCAQLDISVIHNHLCENVSLLSVSHLKSIIIFRWRYWWVFFFRRLPSGLSSKSSSSSSDPTEYSDWLSERSSCHSEPHIKEKQYIAFASVGGHLGAPWHCRLLQTTTAGHAHTVPLVSSGSEVRVDYSARQSL